MKGEREMTATQFVLIVVAGCLETTTLICNLLFVEKINNYIKKSCKFFTIKSSNGYRVVISPFYPNNITYLRMVFIFLAVVLWTNGNLRVAVTLYIISIFGDRVDGMVARSCGLVTDWGKFIDPLCDKLTYLPLLIVLAITDSLSISLVLILVVIELMGQFAVRFVLARQGRSMAANNFGKIKAVVLFALPVYIFILREKNSLPGWDNYFLLLGVILAMLSVVFKIVPLKRILKIIDMDRYG